MRAPQFGFTLLELLLVVFILSALALTASAFVDNQDDQFRFEDTRRRLEMIRRAIVGDAAAVHGGQVIVSGFVADNGVLPGDIASLIADPDPANLGSFAAETFAARGLKSPVFDPDPDSSSGLNNTTGAPVIPLDASNEQLEKGWRQGYLHAAPGSTNAFRDGWGTPGAAPNFGWGFDTNVSDQRTVSSLGKNAANGGADYDADLPDTINAADWSSQIAGLNVRIKTSGDFAGSAANYYLHASLLVYVNGTSGGLPDERWRRYSTDAILASSGFDGTGDGLCDHDANSTTPPQPCPTGEFTLTFAASTHRLPVGRHLLVLVRDNDTVAHNGGADEKPYQIGGTGGSRITRPITCYPAGCTVETLILK